MRHVALAVFACIAGTPPLRAQQSATTQRLVDARQQIGAHKLDSAATLLRGVTGSTDASSSQRAEAFMWLGVVSFYQGHDSGAAAAFREALKGEPLLAAEQVLARLDSGLADIWGTEQTTALCGESVPAWLALADSSEVGAALNASARSEQPPEMMSGAPIPYPDSLRAAKVQGRVVVRVILKTSGRAESIRIIATPHEGFDGAVTEYLRHARFIPAVSSGVAMRSCVIFPIDFKLPG
jgi:TonB family protein